ncbi:MAG TPA: polysaccharide deacetylase family protein [Terriglobia bacterium]|nr:polysaccharide deacetylase family protein [Terriglobia bacterium]
MPNGGAVYLMYHELERAGRTLCSPSPGYVRYVVREADFRRQVQRLAASGIRGVSVSDDLVCVRDGAARVAITFDDGCETDYLVAAPILKEMGLGATFYVVAGFLGRRGYLTADQLRALSLEGFEVGCHSMTHAYLTELDARGLQEEIVASKDMLEQILGRRVEHFSCPGGRWNAAVSDYCRRAGYRSVATSRIGINRSDSDAFNLARIAVQRETEPAGFDLLCRGEGLWLPRAKQALLDGAKKIVGNSAYERLRVGVLNRR